MPSFEGNFLTQRQQYNSLETRDSRLPHGGNPESLSHLGFIRYQVVTPQSDRWTDRIAIANMRSAVPTGTAVARKKYAGQEFAIFRQTLKISHRISTDSCKSPTEETMGAQNFKFDPKFPKNKSFSASNLAFFDEKFMTRRFSNSPKFRGGGCLRPRCH